jgi:AcrR family transcriptional regulator
MSAEVETVDRGRSRGDRQRDAIITAVRELLEEKPFADLSVSTISARAGVARSGFYFYFDSKYSVLAKIVSEAMEELDSLTHNFAPREPDETPASFAQRMVGSAAAVFASNDPIMAACTIAQNTDAEIRDLMADFEDGVIAKIVGVVEQDTGARPISGDLAGLVRILVSTTALTLSRDSAFIGRDGDPQRAIEVVERMWLSALWGGGDLPV